MSKLNNKILAATLVACLSAVPTLVLADGYVHEPRPVARPMAMAPAPAPAAVCGPTNFGAAIVDGLIIRPIGLGATLVGAGIFLGTLPLTALSGSVNAAANALVKGPADFTFRRCLGQF